MAPSSEIYIESTDTDPAVRAQSALQQTQQRLQGRLATLTEVEPGAAEAGESVRAALTEFCTGELRRYLSAADRTLYATASGAAETRLLVRGLRTTADVLDSYVDRLPAAGDAASAATLGRAIEAVLRAHLAVERDVLLPALVGLPGADLPALVGDLDTLLAGGTLEDPAVVDVREIPHGRRHPRIFARFARLAPGESFTLVNNHDPKPLRREFQAAHPDAFTWEYVESGPERWRIRIGREAGADV
ncbi:MULTISPECIES: DUF2249 domain-containing protein [unclassified Streptomyces]|uniref:DUF2249 domain-containing protein n=1 Tax=unclassified Streptomyces TaxID=2593676 RepID=UPI0004BF40BF|nr:MULTISPECIES: DUF2249 domain-containing protein [unclassified Streptomyces]